MKRTLSIVLSLVLVLGTVFGWIFLLMPVLHTVSAVLRYIIILMRIPAKLPLTALVL